MIKQLSNPITPSYMEFKQQLLSDSFAWFYSSNSTFEKHFFDASKYVNVPCYSHTFLARPEANFSRYPVPSSPMLDQVSNIFLELLKFNHITLNAFLRINANCVHPQPNNEVVNTIPHVDHQYPHKNIIMYFSDAGGKTIVENESFEPKEDSVLLFEGQHYIQTPVKKRRVICIATFI